MPSVPTMLNHLALPEINTSLPYHCTRCLLSHSPKCLHLLYPFIVWLTTNLIRFSLCVISSRSSLCPIQIKVWTHHILFLNLIKLFLNFLLFALSVNSFKARRDLDIYFCIFITQHEAKPSRSATYFGKLKKKKK